MEEGLLIMAEKPTYEELEQRIKKIEQEKYDADPMHLRYYALTTYTCPVS